MGKHRKLREAALGCGIILSLAHFASEAAAFTPEPVSPPTANAQGNSGGQSAQPNAAPQAPQVEMTDPFAQAGKSKGTELTIPGIGSVGTIPKLDFGLELLYGPKNNAPDSIPLDQHAPEPEMQIKGTLTHKF